jgi:prepilin-type N-terminal cleavage/methylation domain-containing protein
MQSKWFQAFTLVELIVVITILVILSAVGYVSYTSYLTWVRDTNRISQLKSIWEGLKLYKIKNTLPIPDDKVDIESSWSVIAYQWYLWKVVLWKIDYSAEWKDPKDDTYFSYYLTKDKKYFQLLWHLEEESSTTFHKNLAYFSQTEAVDYSVRYPFVEWARLWILTWTGTDLNIPVQEISSIKTAWNLDIKTATGEYVALLKNGEALLWTWSVIWILERIVKEWWKWYLLENNVLYNTLWWNTVDENCDLNDIVIWTQVWAWCNSTLWNWFEWWKKDDGSNGTVVSCRDYSGNSIGTCTIWDVSMASNTKANTWFTWTNTNGDSEVDNIWWKFYTWTNSSSACLTWYHVPSNGEWAILENYLYGSTCAWEAFDRDGNLTADWNWWWCDGLWWKLHDTKTTSNNIVEALQLPLAGNRTSGSEFKFRGDHTFLWSSTPNGGNAYYRHIYWDNSTVNRTQDVQSFWFSVRCIKD